jgi:hypothetical protein
MTCSSIDLATFFGKKMAFYTGKGVRSARFDQSNFGQRAAQNRLISQSA